MATEYRRQAYPPGSPPPSPPGEDGIKAGWKTRSSTAVLDLTGRPPRAFTEFVQEQAAAWATTDSPV
ncbi:hypothetical protein L3Q67_31940 [Saccharothrix sp. AJ9571]|nr:hypothetical protein L3Q67_31940 [Saccharothrix sp. AJ9571]